MEGQGQGRPASKGNQSSMELPAQGTSLSPQDLLIANRRLKGDSGTKAVRKQGGTQFPEKAVQGFPRSLGRPRCLQGPHPEMDKCNEWENLETVHEKAKETHLACRANQEPRSGLD